MPTLEWIGKDKVINHHQNVPYRVLEEKYTYNAEQSDNMIIRGDNLEALKALLPLYEGKIKCIYIVIWSIYTVCTLGSLNQTSGMIAYLPMIVNLLGCQGRFSVHFSLDSRVNS